MKRAMQVGLIAATALGGVLLWQREANRERRLAHCARNLKAIHGLFTQLVRQGPRKDMPPVGKQNPAHEHFAILVLFTGGASPEIFCCPAGEALPAVREADDSFWLDAESVSYAWRGGRTRLEDALQALAACKHYDGHTDSAGRHRGHPGGVNVLYTDGSVRFVPV